MGRLAIQMLAISRRHAVPKIQSAWFAQAPEFERWDRGGGNVHRLARVDPSVVVEIGGVVHAGATIGESSHVGSGCIVGPDVCIGSSVVLRYNVVLQNCSIGDFCTLHSGVCVGQDGFGFTYDSNNSIVKKPQELRVKIGNSVEIGANSSIDRGSWRDTVIGDNTKLDNLVQIGHNVVIGCNCMICGQVGIAGSCTCCGPHRNRFKGPNRSEKWSYLKHYRARRLCRFSSSARETMAGIGGGFSKTL
ncbi:probable UDP-3-O-acylglucosamine N-acyltransferase 2, mitochondrial isoform X2 [Selaginella moellendorffii]|uniref:probable UDP-3-O-acylglucosamine N-acyltransferase 2, mitochondrial isoform X2 n=1 Tax=Selaginella moellendorffii TaxID=88036 RepID=UPI000D1C712F|nr:probable UDP-3-O-acylglucosamine N-acyltransferase 2, mitochondrial isoform X2 [Selaginella moellendorffii]|eukprot:XP_024515026.1 probable UDP-3-O-acylglucosamine N-acyltransferase 2, mitochondrial isoform X2 [Selaginella moellendorffii]